MRKSTSWRSREYLHHKGSLTSFKEPAHDSNAGNLTAVPSNQQVQQMETEFKEKFLEQLSANIEKRIDDLKKSNTILHRQTNLYSIYGQNPNAEQNLHQTSLEKLLTSQDFAALRAGGDSLQPLAEKLLTVHRLKQLQRKKKGSLDRQSQG